MNRISSWMGWSRRPAAALAGALLIGLAAAAAPPLERIQEAGAPQTAEPGTVYRIPVNGTIELGLAPFIERSLREATRSGARAAILDIETPGGRVDAAQRIVNTLSDAEIPVYAFVNRRALSAGAMIALATDGIFMRPGSTIGAATPVSGEGQKAPEKIVSAMRSEMRAAAEARGLDPRVAEAMVDEDIEIDGITEPGKLLTLTTDEAVRIGYAAVVDDWAGLLAALDLEGRETYTAVTNWAERTVRVLTHPLVTPLLLSLGFLGLIVEIKTPSFGIAGALGGLALTAFFGSHFLIGLAGWEHVILLGVGIILLGLEVFLVPGFGFFGITGIVAVLASIYLSLIGHLPTGADYSQAAAVLSTTLVLVVVGAWSLTRTLPKSGRFLRSGILLGESTARETGYLSNPVRSELVGIRGVALTDLRPAGTGQFGDERVDIVADSGWIPSGTPIEITHSQGWRHVVRSVG